MNNKKPRIIAALLTLLTLLIAILLLNSMSLHYSSADADMRQWPPADSSEILFADEFVAAGNIEQTETADEASPVAESAPAHEAFQNENAGITQPKQQELLSSEQPSHISIKKSTPEPQGPTKAEIEAQEREKRQKETAKAISQRVNFGGSAAGGSGNSTPESAEGPGASTTGLANASVGGRTLEHWSKPSARNTGSITVRVRVDRQGKVIRADYVSGSGTVASNIAARQSCENAALKSQFSVNYDAPATQTGTITYHFK